MAQIPLAQFGEETVHIPFQPAQMIFSIGLGSVLGYLAAHPILLCYAAATFGRSNVSWLPIYWIAVSAGAGIGGMVGWISACKFRGLSLAVNQDSIALVSGQTPVHTICWADVTQVDHGWAYTVRGKDGATLEIPFGVVHFSFPSSRRLGQELQKRIPERTFQLKIWLAWGVPTFLVGIAMMSQGKPASIAFSQGDVNSLQTWIPVAEMACGAILAMFGSVASVMALAIFADRKTRRR